ncbi:MAG TPA: bifunctional UDP-N-acetylglucosamine diphosphorylase/glucosamine-1-phosphate N-acetyltransferase GlmU [Actinomycetota bacterium]|nr:bifunctional UDP-N-acetylglucosamine diphosphorylase/glucosamine-1-phosphate N-acetyltransferase GlmU [Actinomycetota bacterium]
MAEKNKTRTRSLAVVVLAAGKGKRLRSSTPKVLHPVVGKPALWHVLQLAKAARPTRIAIVTGHGANAVRDAVASWGIAPSPVFVEQTDQLGTGHAVLVAEDAVGDADDVLVLGGDFDPITPADVRKLVSTHRRTRSAITTATTELDDPGGYGRVVREGPRLVEIVEDIDASPEIRAIREVWLLAMVARRTSLYATLPTLDRDNRQREYYLNRVVPILIDKGEKVSVVPCDTGGVMGLNSRNGLAAVERVMRERINARHLANGVTLVDPATTYIDEGVRIGADTVIQPLTFLQDDARVGRGCVVGPSTRVSASTVGDGSRVEFAVIQDARIGRDVQVGPFARLRPGTKLADGVIVGSYVEVKNSAIGERSKVPHLSYVGDATVGKRTNIGAANVTANWDGYAKHRTTIGDDVRTGSDTIMVAPVRLGSGAVTGAGSVISKDVPPGALAVERTEQRNVRGYRKRKDAQRAEAARSEGDGT